MDFSEFNTLADAAVAMHVLFQNFVQAGFTEDQALKLCAYGMAAAAGDTDTDTPS